MIPSIRPCVPYTRSQKPQLLQNEPLRYYPVTHRSKVCTTGAPVPALEFVVSLHRSCSNDVESNSSAFTSFLLVPTAYNYSDLVTISRTTVQLPPPSTSVALRSWRVSICTRNGSRVNIVAVAHTSERRSSWADCNGCVLTCPSSTPCLRALPLCRG